MNNTDNYQTAKAKFLALREQEDSAKHNIWILTEEEHFETGAQQKDLRRQIQTLRRKMDELIESYPRLKRYRAGR